MATTGLPSALEADLDRIRESIRMISPKWTVRVLLALSRGPLEYRQIKAQLPWLRDGQLHPRVRALCEAGIADRQVTQRLVSYRLTERGGALLPVLTSLAAWGKAHLEPPASSAVENTEDSLSLLTPRQTPAILAVLKLRGETSARALASILTPEAHSNNIYPPLRRAVEDGLVETSRRGPYRLSASGRALDGVFAALSTWAAGQPPSHAASHPLWGVTPPGHHTIPGDWVSHRSRPQPAGETAKTAASRCPAAIMPWQRGDIFSHALPARPDLPVGGQRR